MQLSNSGVWGKCEIRYCPPVDLADATDLYQTFESNFTDYWDMGVFKTKITLED